MINQIIEKYLTSYKNQYSGDTLDVYSNPTKSELRKLSDTYRFIADSKNKTIYFADGWTAQHVPMWEAIMKETKWDSSRATPYRGTLMCGELWQSKDIRLDSIDLYKDSEYAVWSNIDWTWTKPWLPNIDKAISKYKKEKGY